MQSLYLLYHELQPARSPYSYALECGEFEKQLQLFARLPAQGPNILQPQVTFDDGHLSNYEYALPLLSAHSMQARFFITAGWTGAKTGYMTWEQVRALAQAAQIVGAHGWSHKLLTHCSAPELDQELRGARATLEDRLGCAVTSMSLPGGRFNRRVLDACEAAGYTQVFTSVPRPEPLPTGATIGRLNIRGGMSPAALENILRPETGSLASLVRQYRWKQSAKSILGDNLYAKVWAVLNRHQPDAQAE